MAKDELRGIPIDIKLRFVFWRAHFNGYEFCLLEAKKSENHASTDCLRLAKRLEELIYMPIVFLFQNLQFVERNRLIERGVYFIVSDKYAYLPFLIINTREVVQKKAEELSAVAQYILLYHLQVGSLNGASMTELEKKLPYTYVTISRAFKALDDLQLCKITKDENRNKRIYFDDEPRDIWGQVLPYLKSPIKRVVYCDSIKGDMSLVYGSITALSHYTHLNPDEVNTFVMDTKQFKAMQEEKAFENLNASEGNIRMEIWNYPPLLQDYADPLSLYLTLKDDKDPRVEKELETMIDRLW
ncbi:MAG: hypothetical protein K2M96_01600 [Prevotella sp.]|nr:hypothetical protein [Prevotella sp.]